MLFLQIINNNNWMTLSLLLCIIAVFWIHDEIIYIQCISYARPYYRMTNNNTNESSVHRNTRHRQDHVSSSSSSLSSYEYQTKYIPIESCRYMNVTLCQKEDEYYGLMKEQILSNQRRRLSTKLGTDVRVLVLLVQFTDHNNTTTDRILPTIQQMDELFNGNGGTDINPVGSIRNYLYVNSLTQYHASFDVADWQMTNNTESYFAGGVSGKQGPTILQNIFIPILNEMDNAGFDFTPYDSLKIGELDQLVILTSGYGAEYGEPQSGCNINTVPNRIWSAGTAYSTEPWIGRQNIKVNSWTISSAYDSILCGNIPAKMGPIIHEYTHGWDVPDLHDESLDPVIPGGIGFFDIMSSSIGWKNDPRICGHMSAWVREQIGWVTPIDIVEDGYYPLQAAEASGQIYKIKLSNNEYLLIENRQPILWDSDMDGSGIVIYRINNLKTDQSQRSYPGQSNWPNEHYMVSVLQADGLFEIEKGINGGNSGDFWTFGMSLKPGGNDPNTDSLSAGRVETGITIEVVTAQQLIMMIRVSGFGGSTSSSTNLTDRSAFRTFDDEKQIGTTDDPNTSRYIVQYIISILISAAALIGFIVLFL